MFDIQQVKTGFHGTVLLKECLWDPQSGIGVHGVCGMISIHRDEEVTGFKVGRSESNWIATVKGRLRTFHFLGCQVRGFVEHDGKAASTNFINLDGAS